ncbi:MAG: flavin-dependent oxidoreductase [Acidimicrobiales bacterium]
MTVLIAGAGIGGLTAALTCHQLGVPAVVFESVREIRPLGVGINLQPNAVRELIDLGLGHRLAEIGVETREWALVGRNGNDIYAEPRGIGAGYRWPQYSVHRGRLQMALLDAVVERLGPDAVRTGHRVTGYRTGRGGSDGVTALVDRRDGGRVEEPGRVLIGADGIHSAVRAQLHPDQGPPAWGGAIMWRGTSYGRPIRTGASFTLVGSMDQRFVHYPIGPTDPATGLQLQNWIAELTVDPAGGWPDSDWNRSVPVEQFIGPFETWDFGWLDVPAVIRSTDTAFEFPMVDRDPVDRWVDGATALLGDAAHVMYPVGSNGASQAIVDARVLGAAMVRHGVGPKSLAAYEDELLVDVNAVVLRNRQAGPIGILGEVDRRCGGVFDDIAEVMRPEEIDAFMADYKRAAGFAVDHLNASGPTIAPGARVG